MTGRPAEADVEETLLWIPCRPAGEGEAVVLARARADQGAAEVVGHKLARGQWMLVIREPGQPLPRTGDRVSYTGGRPWKARLGRVLR